MKRAMLFIAAALLLTTGCRSRQAQYTPSDAEAASETLPEASTAYDTATGPGAEGRTDADGESKAARDGSVAGTDEKQELVSDLEGFFKEWRPLKIQKYGDSIAYDASESLVYTFSDIISKSETVAPESAEGKKQADGFDYGHYDYRLKFEGARDILFTREGNVFRFEGEERRYTLWGSADPLWDTLVFDAGSKTVGIGAEKIRVMSIDCSEDLDGDGKAENIELVYERYKSDNSKGDLVLSVNGSKIAVVEGYATGMFTRPYRTVLQMPEIRFLPERDGKSKAMLVIYTWATNGIGSTGVANAYRYENGGIMEIGIADTERVLKYKGDKTVSIEYPAFGVSMDLKIDDGYYAGYFGDEDSFRQRLESKGAFAPHPLWYLVNDFNRDGRDELCCVSVLSEYPFALCTQYSYYVYEGGEMKPVLAYAADYGDGKMAYLKGYIFELIHYKGYLDIGDSGITDENFQPFQGCTPGEITMALEELQKDGILVRRGDRLYVSY